jgi:ABC-2 type transport system permease protein
MLTIAWKDLEILFRDRNNLVGAFLLPIVFIVVFLGVSGLAAGGGGDENGDPEKVPLAVVDNDGGEAAATLRADLEAHAGLAITVYAEADAMALLEGQQVSHVLVIPAAFTTDFAAGDVTTTLVLKTNTLDRGRSEAILMAVEGVSRNMSLQRQIVASLEALAAMQAANSSFDPSTSAELAIPIAKRQFEASQGRPLVTVTQEQPASLGREEPIEISGVQIGVPGFAVLFIFLTAQITARSIYDEKKTGSFRRLLAAPLGKRSILIGKLIPNFVVVLLQAVFLFAAGMFVLPLMGLDALRLGNDPVALVLLVLATAMCCTCLGILIAAIARTEAQIGGVAGLLLWVLAFLGGSFIPLFLINDSMATLGQVTPHFWAVTGFYDLLTRGQGLASIIDSLVALLGFSALFFVVGTWRFEFD